MKRTVPVGLALVAFLLSATGNQTYAHQDTPVSVSDKIGIMYEKFNKDARNLIDVARSVDSHADMQSNLLSEVAHSAIDTAFSGRDTVHSAYVELNLYKLMDVTDQAKAKTYLLSEMQHAEALVEQDEKANNGNLNTRYIDRHPGLVSDLIDLKSDIREAEDLLNSDDILK